jgi:protein-S-isoprenylcysteine O-methyltransferase Ste14
MTRLPPMEPFSTTPALYFVIGCWLAFAAIFLLRKRAASKEVRRDQRAGLPIAVQGVAFFITWTIRRHAGDPLITPGLNPYLNIFACALALSAVVWVLVSVRTLGKQWTVAARLVEGHKLVMEGPYSLVRNPIYTGMFGMLLATGIILTRWQALLIAIVIFLLATLWRIRVEEDLLRGQFGAEFEEYCKRVPAALLPGL